MTFRRLAIAWAAKLDCPKKARDGFAFSTQGDVPSAR
jgi:hypothetical protein